MKNQIRILITVLAWSALQIGCSKEEIASGAMDMLSNTIIDQTEMLKEHKWRYYTFSIYDAESSGGSIRIIGKHMSGPPLDFILMEK